MSRSEQNFRRTSRPLQLARIFAACVLSATLSACQTASPENVLDVSGAPAGSSDTPAVTRMERVGSGAVVVGLITELNAKSPARHRERDRHDGAMLAAKSLGDGTLTLAVFNSDGTSQDVASGAASLVDQGAKLLIGPPDHQLLTSLASIPSRPPIIALASNDAASQGLFAFVTDDVDGAIEVSAYASAAGRKRILVVAPKEFPARSLERLTSGLRDAGATMLGSVPFTTASRAELNNYKDAIAGAEAVLLAPGLDSPAVAVSGLRATGALPEKALILGNGGWTDRQVSDPLLFGSLVCRFDRSGVGQTAERFRTEFGRAMSTDAAYAFDAIALAAGLTRLKGDKGLTEAVLTSPAGFRGVLGPFRLEKNGSVRRNCSILRLEKDGLKLIDPAPDGF